MTVFSTVIVAFGLVTVFSYDYVIYSVINCNDSINSSYFNNTFNSSLPCNSTNITLDYYYICNNVTISNHTYVNCTRYINTTVTIDDDYSAIIDDDYDDYEEIDDDIVLDNMNIKKQRRRIFGLFSFLLLTIPSLIAFTFLSAILVQLYKHYKYKHYKLYESNQAQEGDREGGDNYFEKIDSSHEIDMLSTLTNYDYEFSGESYHYNCGNQNYQGSNHTRIDQEIYSKLKHNSSPEKHFLSDTVRGCMHIFFIAFLTVLDSNLHVTPLLFLES